ncbi:MAG: hypothetical protein C4522_15170 [Desulfobacteraceae bacterium]|nr:MAG: hypothetical protein C4522_15170 [Desulfobacteraceae bacterium]
MMNVESRKRFKESAAIKRYQRIAWVLPLIICISSVLISIYQSSWEYFSRAGSLIVLVAVYVAYKDWSGDIYQVLKKDYFTMSEFLAIGCLDSLANDERNELIRKCKDIEDSQKINKSFVTYASRRFRKMEAVLLAIGTLIWGYGDFFLNLIWRFNA